MDLDTIEQIIREHSQGHAQESLDSWLSYCTLCRFRDWVPAPNSPNDRLLDIGCYQPAIGYYAALGWRFVTGVAKEEGECNRASSYSLAVDGKAENIVCDVESGKLPIGNETIDTVLLLEVLEHFGVDPINAFVEINRVLKPGGRLILSTPNAAAFGNYARIATGLGPYTHVEFSGFSTNRHNRLYDSVELGSILKATGFHVHQLESRSYVNDAGRPTLAIRLFWQALKLLDRVVQLKMGKSIAREEFLFAVATKTGPVTDRFPSFLYFSQDDWPDWFKAIQEKASNR